MAKVSASETATFVAHQVTSQSRLVLSSVYIKISNIYCCRSFGYNSIFY
jgi:hypothetical protein